MTRRRYRVTMIAACALVLPLLWASAAQAISIIKVREVYAGANNDSYVELEAYSSYVYAGDTLPGKSLILFDVEGNPTVRFTFSKGNNLGSDNTHFLIADTGEESSFGVVPDIVDPQMEINPAGGAACWNVGDTPVDCVAWGDFSGQAALQTYAGTGVGNPAFPAGIPAGKAIERSEAANCPTWLEGEDDTDDSAADFFEATPNPQSPESPDPDEHICESGMPDDTAVVEKPATTSNDESPHFTYTATGATSFQCKLDEARFSACPAGGEDYSSLADGSHTFQVRALNANGPDASPAVYTWTVDTVAPEATIVTHPAAQSFGRSATFAFSSGEPGSTFRCSLDTSAAAGCRSGIVLQSLTAGSHTFNVTAIDAAGNAQASPTTYTWTVDTAAARDHDRQRARQHDRRLVRRLHLPREQAGRRLRVQHGRGTVLELSDQRGGLLTARPRRAQVQRQGGRLRRRSRGESTELFLCRRPRAPGATLQEGVPQEGRPRNVEVRASAAPKAPSGLAPTWRSSASTATARSGTFRARCARRWNARRRLSTKPAFAIGATRSRRIGWPGCGMRSPPGPNCMAPGWK